MEVSKVDEIEMKMSEEESRWLCRSRECENVLVVESRRVSRMLEVGDA